VTQACMAIASVNCGAAAASGMVAAFSHSCRQSLHSVLRRSGPRLECPTAGNLEGVLASLDKDKYPVPEPFPFEEARRLFKGTNAGQTL
jgi:hypothetical protein